MTSTWYMDSLQVWIKDFNALMLPESYLNNPWNILKDAASYKDCMPDTSSYETGFDGRTFFPYDLKKISSRGLMNKKKDFSVLRETPFGDSFTTDFAIRLIREETLGKNGQTDFLSISYAYIQA